MSFLKNHVSRIPSSKILMHKISISWSKFSSISSECRLLICHDHFMIGFFPACFLDAWTSNFFWTFFQTYVRNWRCQNLPLDQKRSALVSQSYDCKTSGTFPTRYVRILADCRSSTECPSSTITEDDVDKFWSIIIADNNIYIYTYIWDDNSTNAAMIELAKGPARL